MIMNLDSQSRNKPLNTDTLIRNFEWLRLGMTETITSEDLTDILSGIAHFQILLQLGASFRWSFGPLSAWGSSVNDHRYHASQFSSRPFKSGFLSQGLNREIVLFSSF